MILKFISDPEKSGDFYSIFSFHSCNLQIREFLRIIIIEIGENSRYHAGKRDFPVGCINHPTLRLFS